MSSPSATSDLLPSSPKERQLTLTLRAPRASFQYRFSTPRIVIGRLPSSTLWLPAPEVSARHCQLIWDEEALWLIDLHARHGTWLNGARLSPLIAARCEEGSQLQVGPYALEISLEQCHEPPTSSLEMSRRAAELGQAEGGWRLWVLSGPEQGRSFPLFEHAPLHLEVTRDKLSVVEEGASLIFELKGEQLWYRGAGQRALLLPPGRPLQIGALRLLASADGPETRKALSGKRVTLTLTLLCAVLTFLWSISSL